MPPESPAPIAGLRGIEHIGMTVPDMDLAVTFFSDVLGASTLYETGPLSAGDNWMAVNLGVDADAVIARLVMLRLGHGPALELFEFEQRTRGPSAELAARHPPLQNAVGGSHLAFYVDDIDAGVESLRAHQLIVLGEIKRVIEGPSAGLAWVHFMAPWGQQLELVSYPNGVAAYAQAVPAVWRPGSERDEPIRDSDDALDADPA